MRLKKIGGRTTARGHTNSWKTWSFWNRGKLLLANTFQDNTLHRNERDWTDGQNTALSCTITRSTELSPDTLRGRSPNSSQRCGECSTIIEEREVSWSWQHPSRTGPSRWKGHNCRSQDNLQQNLADRRMANPLDPILGLHTSQERQPAAVPEYRTISFISHPSKVVLKIILDRLKPQPEKIISEEQAGFRAPQSRSSTWESFTRNISSTSKSSAMSTWT